MRFANSDILDDSTRPSVTGIYSTVEPVGTKFVRRYSKGAHLFCAAHSHVHTLYGFEELPGDWYMVVMEDINHIYTGRTTTSGSHSLNNSVNVIVTNPSNAFVLFIMLRWFMVIFATRIFWSVWMKGASKYSTLIGRGA